MAPRFPSSVAVNTDESIADSSAALTIENSMAPQSTVRSTTEVVMSPSDHSMSLCGYHTFYVSAGEPNTALRESIEIVVTQH